MTVTSPAADVLPSSIIDASPSADIVTTGTVTAGVATDVATASFEELVAHEVQRAPGGSDRPVALVSPLATPAQRQVAHRLNKDGEAPFFLTLLTAASSVVLGATFADTGSLFAALAVFCGGVGGSMGAFYAREGRVARRRRSFDAENPQVRLVGPDWAISAYDRFTTASTALTRLDVPDDVRASLVETRRVMDDLLLAVCDLQTAGLVDSPDGKRIYAQMRRHGAEAAALVAVARQREAILDGRSAHDVLTASAGHTMATAATQMQDENAHLSAVLDGTPEALGISQR